MNLLALPSKPQTFFGKALSDSKRHTAVSLLALPMQVQHFRTKQTGVEITAVSLLALPMPPTAFENKSVVPVGRGEPESSHGQLHGWNKRRTLQWGGKFKPD